MANAVGAGNVISTAKDLSRWAAYLFHEASPQVLERMLQDYGEDPDGDRIHLGLSSENGFVGHQGALDSYRSFFGYRLDLDTGVFYLSNVPGFFNPGDFYPHK